MNKIVDFFLDTEFNAFAKDGRVSIELISIGLVCSDGREYYAQNPYQYYKRNEFVVEQVIPKLEHCDLDSLGSSRCDIAKRACIPTAKGPCPWKTMPEMQRDLYEFFDPLSWGPNNHLWMHSGAYDMVVLSAIFDGFQMLPDNIPHQFIDNGVVEGLQCDHVFTATNAYKHHALYDARELRDEVMMHKNACKMFREVFWDDDPI